MEQKNFSCSIDKFSKIVSGLFIVFAIFFALIPWIHDLEGKPELAGVLFPVVGAGLLILSGVTFLLSPTRYSVSEQGIKIERRAGTLVIPANEIKNIRLPNDKELNFPIRTFGNGGLFGYTGRYYTKHIGSMMWQCTRRDRQIIIERHNKLPLVISPDEPAKFVWAAGAAYLPETQGTIK